MVLDSERFPPLGTETQLSPRLERASYPQVGPLLSGALLVGLSWSSRQLEAMGTPVGRSGNGGSVPITLASFPGGEGTASAGAVARARLERLKAERFPPAGRERRIALALEALARVGGGIALERDVWRWVAQDADLEDV